MPADEINQKQRSEDEEEDQTFFFYKSLVFVAVLAHQQNLHIKIT